MSFVKEDGKGFVGAHTGDDAFFEWPEFRQMIGATSTTIRGGSSTRR